MSERPAPAPFCAHLRTKKWFTLDTPARTEEDLLDASGHCWCQKTMLTVGPDGDIVDPEDCRAGRSCHRLLGHGEGPDAA